MSARTILGGPKVGSVAGLTEGKRQSMSGGWEAKLVQEVTVVWRPVCYEGIEPGGIYWRPIAGPHG